MNTTIAVLMTCHNRREKTLRCLTCLFNNELQLPNKYKLEIFLVDDGSKDGTGKAVESKFPAVHVIEGTGNLFWNQGMRLAWKTATNSGQYDFFLWLNDDITLDLNALLTILNNYYKVIEKDRNPIILTTACRKAQNVENFSYGGRSENGPVIPNGSPQSCKYINGNIVLVPKEVYEQIGILSDDYTHGMGDIDYGLRAQANGFACYTTSKYLATCPYDREIPKWYDPNVRLPERIKNFYAPNGLNIKEYNAFRKKFWGKKWIFFAIKSYFKMLMPNIYSRFK